MAGAIAASLAGTVSGAMRAKRWPMRGGCKSLFVGGRTAREIKNPQPEGRGLGQGRGAGSGLLDEAGLDGLDRDPEALGAAVGQLHADALEIRAELALRDA